MSVLMHDMPPVSLLASDLRDARGAAKIFEERSGKPCSPDMVRYMVRQGKLRAYIFRDGRLIELDYQDKERQGQALYFAAGDIYNAPLPPLLRGRKSHET